MNTLQIIKKSTGSRYGLSAWVLTMLVAGALFAWWIASRTDHEMREALLDQARLVAGSVNIKRVQSLTGTETDLSSPDYLRLKEQFGAIRAARPECRFVYLLGRRSNRKAFFFADSEPVGAKDHSAPGQAYEEVSAVCRRVFDTKVALTDGPVSDRWGTWVSALVPLIDPQSGKLLAVLGMDITASSWKRDVVAGTALPVGLMLMLIIGIMTAIVAARQMRSSPRPVLLRLLPPLAIILFLMFVGAGALLWQQHRAQLYEKSSRAGKEVARDLRQSLAQQAQGLTLAAQAIAADARMQRALQGRDEARLLADWRNLFETLHREDAVTHFYFFDANRVCLLRIHKPEKRGDKIDRFTALEAERTGKTAWGIELGPLGTFTLRVVLPVFAGDKLVGYLELGKEIEDVLKSIQQQGDSQLAVILNKKTLNRETWESGMRLLGREADWNRLHRNVVGYASQGRLPEAFVFMADLDSDSSYVHGVMDKEISSDGRDWHAIASSLKDASGKEVGCLLVMRDITVEKAAFARTMMLSGVAGVVLLAAMLGLIIVLLRRTDSGIRAYQEELSESHARMRAITDSALDAILMMDPNGNISYWNPAAESLSGYNKEEAIGKPLHLLIAPQRYHEAHQQAFTRFQQTGQGDAISRISELSVRHKDGHEIAIELSLSALHLNGGWHSIGILHDISERKMIEKALLESNREMAAATALANEMAMRAEMANIAKSEFLANMSHEIRTPMNGVIGMTGLLLDTRLDDDQRRYAEIVRASGEALLSLINDILDFSKIEAGKLDMETLDFDLRATLDGFAEMMALKAHEKGLEFLCAAAPNVPTFLMGDPGRLRQILVNLTGNAVKFTHKGEISVRALLEKETDTDALIRFSVRDTGIGIPANKQSMLFEKFTQVDASTTRKYGGTGLGLAISKQLSEAMGGEIGVNSEEGKGTEFWFTVRLRKQQKRLQDGELSLQSGRSSAGLRGARILIVDDNETNREILNVQFTTWGARPDEAPDGMTCLRKLREAVDENDAYCVAVLDMQMPGMDGEMLGRAIRADAILRNTRLIMMTSLGQRGDAARLKEIGFEAFLPKPVRQTELLESLTALLSGKAAPNGKHMLTRHTIRELRRTNMRILLAEDNIINQQVALGILNKLGMRADAVANGAEAIAALEHIPYDLVLMDVQMPEMNGYEATMHIRDLKSSVLNHQIPIIAMTANAMDGDREKCLEAGMNDYVSKPVAPDALADTLDKWLPENREVSHQNWKDSTLPENHSTPHPSSLIFNKAGMLERMMGDKDLARTIMDGFLGDIPLQIHKLQQFLESGDAASVERQAHTIKGAAANVGGTALSELAFEIEKAGKTGDLSSIKERMQDLVAKFDQLRQEMEKGL